MTRTMGTAGAVVALPGCDALTAAKPGPVKVSVFSTSVAGPETSSKDTGPPGAKALRETLTDSAKEGGEKEGEAEDFVIALSTASFHRSVDTEETR